MENAKEQIARTTGRDNRAELTAEEQRL